MEGKDKLDNKNIESICSDTEEINEKISEKEEEIYIEIIHIQKWFFPEKYNAINPLASPSAGAPALKYGYVNTLTPSPGEVKGLMKLNLLR